MSIDPLTSVSAAAPPAATVADAAAGFEELLVRQLAQSLVDTTAGDASSDGDTGGDGTDATTSLLQSFLPDALADAVKNAGGLGLAPSLAAALEGRA